MPRAATDTCWVKVFLQFFAYNYQQLEFWRKGQPDEVQPFEERTGNRGNFFSEWTQPTASTQNSDLSHSVTLVWRHYIASVNTKGPRLDTGGVYISERHESSWRWTGTGMFRRSFGCKFFDNILLPEEGGSRFRRNVGPCLTVYIPSQQKRQDSNLFASYKAARVCCLLVLYMSRITKSLVKRWFMLSMSDDKYMS